MYRTLLLCKRTRCHNLQPAWKVGIVEKFIKGTDCNIRGAAVRVFYTEHKMIPYKNSKAVQF